MNPSSSEATTKSQDEFVVPVNPSSSTIVTSLTAPRDRPTPSNAPGNVMAGYTLKKGKAALTDQETLLAMTELVDGTALTTFPRHERGLADPDIPNQLITLFSFVPCKGATPDEDGFYGFAKIRGTYPTLEEANERAEDLIRNVDSYHKIYYTYTGRPFPCTTSSNFSKDKTEVDIRKKGALTISQSIKRQKEADQAAIESVQKRKEELLKDTTQRDPNEEEDLEKEYTELKVKTAHLTYTYLEHQKMLDTIKPLILKARERVAEINLIDASIAKTYKDRYMKARRQVGLPDDDQSFIKYLNEDVDLGF